MKRHVDRYVVVIEKSSHVCVTRRQQITHFKR